MKLTEALFCVAMVMTAFAGLVGIDPFDGGTAWSERIVGGILTAALIAGIWLLQRRVRAGHDGDAGSSSAGRRGFWISLALAAGAVALSAGVSRWRQHYDGFDTFHGMPVAAGRRQLLRTVPPASEAGAPPVWGVLIERSAPPERDIYGASWDGRQTALWLGSPSQRVRQEGTLAEVARALCEEAAKVVDHTEPVRDLPFRNPLFASPGHVRFYLLTDGGLRTREVPIAALGRSDQPLAHLFAASARLRNKLAETSVILNF